MDDESRGRGGPVGSERCVCVCVYVSMCVKACVPV